MHCTMNGKRPHSKPVPQIYKYASKILRRYENKEGTLKTLIFQERFKDYRRLYGLLYKTVQFSVQIKTALAQSKIFEEQPNFDPYLAAILTAQLLGKGELRGDCKPIVTLLKYAEAIKYAFSSLPDETKQNTEEHYPRYVRINTLTAYVERVHSHLKSEGWIHKDYDPSEISYDDFLSIIQNLDEWTYVTDYHIPELLVFPPNTPFWNSLLYTENAVILQDKASCLPVFVSNIRPGSSVIDACAAPGNKTSYIAALMDNRGKVCCVEKDTKRFATLQELVQSRGASCVSFEHTDFLKLNPADHPDVEHIFLDPTCSSSGLNIHNDQLSWQRINGLAKFQRHILLFALSFPSVKEVIYSTCSIYPEENEEVVSKGLKFYQNVFELENIGSKLNGWKNFGKSEYDFGDYCIRTESDVDKCQGFFVAKFVRKSLSDIPMKNKENCVIDVEEEHTTVDDNLSDSLTNIMKKRKFTGIEDEKDHDDSEENVINKIKYSLNGTEHEEDAENSMHGNITKKKKRKHKMSERKQEESTEDDNLQEIYTNMTKNSNVNDRKQEERSENDEIQEKLVTKHINTETEQEERAEESNLRENITKKRKKKHKHKERSEDESSQEQEERAEESNLHENITKKRKKKHKHKERSEDENSQEILTKKKKTRKAAESEQEEKSDYENLQETLRKKKKKHKIDVTEQEERTEDDNMQENFIKKKKKYDIDKTEQEKIEDDGLLENVIRKKKKKKENHDVDEADQNERNGDDNVQKHSKKKKKKHTVKETEQEETTGIDNCSKNFVKKKKKHRDREYKENIEDDL